MNPSLVQRLSSRLLHLRLFHQLPRYLLHKFLTSFHYQRFAAEKYIWQNNDPGLSFCVILSGEIAVFKNKTQDENNYNNAELIEPNLLCVLNSNDSFGFNAILEKHERNTTLICLSDVELAILSYEAYETLMKQINTIKPTADISEIIKILSQNNKDRTNNELKALLPIFAHNKVFQQFDAQALLTTAVGLNIKSYNTADILQVEGRDSKKLFFLLNGSISIHRNSTKEIKKINENKPTHAQEMSAKAGNITPPEHHDDTTNIFETTHHNNNNYSHWQKFKHLLAFVPAPNPETTEKVINASGLHIPTAFGPCVSIQLPWEMSEFTDSVSNPMFFAKNNHTFIAREPVIVAELGYDYLCHVLFNLNKQMKLYQKFKSAIAIKPNNRAEAEISILDQLLKNVAFFQFKQSKIRKAVCRNLTFQCFPANYCLYFQGQFTENFYIVLSGSISIHQQQGTTVCKWQTDKELKWSENEISALSIEDYNESSSSTKNGNGNEHGNSYNPYYIDRMDQRVDNIDDLLSVFGACESLVRSGQSLGDQALISNLPRSTSAISRTYTECLVLSKSDYLAICEPSDAFSLASTDLLVSLIQIPPGKRSAADIITLKETLKNIQYFTEMKQETLQLAVEYLEFEQLEGETIVFEENDMADYVYIIVSGCVGVHLANRKSPGFKQLKSHNSHSDSKASKNHAFKPNSTYQNILLPAETVQQSGLITPRPAVDYETQFITTKNILNKTAIANISNYSAAERSLESKDELDESNSSKNRINLSTDSEKSNSVGHLSQSEVSLQYGPCVNILSSGSVFGDLSIAHSGESNQRSATVITIEPSFFLKLHREVFIRMQLSSNKTNQGTVSFSQSAIANFLSSVPLIKQFNFDYSTLKRIAYHVTEAKYKQNQIIVQQGQKGEFINFLVNGTVNVQRELQIKPKSKKSGNSKTIFHSQKVNHACQEISTGLLDLNHPGERRLIDLCSIDSTEIFSSHECIKNLAYSSSYIVSSVSAQVLSIKKTHFLHFLNKKSLELINEMHEIRSKYYEALISNYLSNNFACNPDQTKAIQANQTIENVLNIAAINNKHLNSAEREEKKTHRNAKVEKQLQSIKQSRKLLFAIQSNSEDRNSNHLSTAIPPESNVSIRLNSSSSSQIATAAYNNLLQKSLYKSKKKSAAEEDEQKLRTVDEIAANFTQLLAKPGTSAASLVTLLTPKDLIVNATKVTDSEEFQLISDAAKEAAEKELDSLVGQSYSNAGALFDENCNRLALHRYFNITKQLKTAEMKDLNKQRLLEQLHATVAYAQPLFIQDQSQGSSSKAEGSQVENTDFNQSRPFTSSSPSYSATHRSLLRSQSGENSGNHEAMSWRDRFTQIHPINNNQTASLHLSASQPIIISSYEAKDSNSHTDNRMNSSVSLANISQTQPFMNKASISHNSSTSLLPPISTNPGHSIPSSASTDLATSSPVFYRTQSYANWLDEKQEGDEAATLHNSLSQSSRSKRSIYNPLHLFRHRHKLKQQYKLVQKAAGPSNNSSTRPASSTSVTFNSIESALNSGSPSLSAPIRSSQSVNLSAGLGVVARNNDATANALLKQLQQSNN
jgi:CRP-like cAMP-binding protein